MAESGADSAQGLHTTRWTLIRGARQLLTLRGADGPRRRSCLNDLSIIADGAMLLRDGIIHEVGTSRRVENMEAARLAREIDATGKIVMPGFVDPDCSLTAPSSPNEADMRLMSRRRLESRAASLASDAIRYGVTTLGANTLAAPDLQNTLRALRIYRAMDLKPARIRPIVSPHWREGVSDYVTAVRRTRLASIFEIDVPSAAIDYARNLAGMVASTGYETRFRTDGVVTGAMEALALAAGSRSFIGAVAGAGVAESGYVHILPGSELLTPNDSPVRAFLDSGGALALSSGYRRGVATSMNPQYLLYSACRNAGLSIEEAIAASTHNAACALGISKETGSLAPGKSADVCIMDLADYRELAGRPGHHDVWMVMCAGRVVYRRAMPLLR